MTLAQLASLLQGEAHGPFELPLDGPGAYDDAQEGQVVVAFDEAAVALAEAGPAAAVVVPRGLTSAKPTIEVDDPRQALARLLVAFAPSSAPAGVHPSAVVDPSVAVGPDVTIGPGAVVEADVVLGARCQLGPRCVVTAGCRLGDDVRLHPGVVLYPKTVLGNRVVIHAGSVIGADGFGYQFESGRHHKIPQLGQVIIDDDVEIGANTTIDRATLGATRIGEGTKIDNLVMIAHNCKIGRHCVIISQVGIAGSVEVGDYAVIAGQVGVKDHLKIGPQAVIAAQSGVMRDVEPKAVMAGSPAMPQQQWFRQIAGYKRMHDMHLRLRRVESRLGLGEQPDA